jgi:hypothetical protein
MCLDDINAYRQCDNATGDGCVCGAIDGYSDRNIAQISHTSFLESTNYSSEVAAGVQDIYQNCFVPGKGPMESICDPWANPTGCCPVTVSGAAPQPYCCNGVPSAAVCHN